MQQHITYDEEQKVRLDLFLTTKITSPAQQTRSYWQKMIKHGYVAINNEVTRKPNALLVLQDTVTIEWPEHVPLEVEIEILYEDADVVVIYKPAGVLSHSKGVFNPEYTVADFAQTKLTEKSENDRAGIVHRLDRATSGVMVLAKHNEAHAFLQKQFAARRTKKTYIAVVEGIIKQDKYEVDLPIARNPKKPQTFRIHRSGKSAQTLIEVTERLANATVLELSPYTGRTHQLRVHCAHIHHPIVGDGLYDAKEVFDSKRILLHAYSLEITLPSKERKTFIAPMPQDMSSYIHEHHATTDTSSK